MKKKLLTIGFLISGAFNSCAATTIPGAGVGALEEGRSAEQAKFIRALEVALPKDSISSTKGPLIIQTKFDEFLDVFKGDINRLISVLSIAEQSQSPKSFIDFVFSYEKHNPSVAEKTVDAVLEKAKEALHQLEKEASSLRALAAKQQKDLGSNPTKDKRVELKRTERFHDLKRKEIEEQAESIRIAQSARTPKKGMCLHGVCKALFR